MLYRAHAQFAQFPKLLTTGTPTETFQLVTFCSGSTVTTSIRLLVTFTTVPFFGSPREAHFPTPWDIVMCWSGCLRQSQRRPRRRDSLGWRSSRTNNSCPWSGNQNCRKGLGRQVARSTGPSCPALLRSRRHSGRDRCRDPPDVIPTRTKTPQIQERHP